MTHFDPFYSLTLLSMNLNGLVGDHNPVALEVLQVQSARRGDDDIFSGFSLKETPANILFEDDQFLTFENIASRSLLIFFSALRGPLSILGLLLLLLMMVVVMIMTMIIIIIK